MKLLGYTKKEILEKCVENCNDDGIEMFFNFDTGKFEYYEHDKAPEEDNLVIILNVDKKYEDYRQLNKELTEAFNLVKWGLENLLDMGDTPKSYFEDIKSEVMTALYNYTYLVLKLEGFGLPEYIMENGFNGFDNDTQEELIKLSDAYHELN